MYENMLTNILLRYILIVSQIRVRPYRKDGIGKGEKYGRNKFY